MKKPSRSFFTQLFTPGWLSRDERRALFPFLGIGDHRAQMAPRRPDRSAWWCGSPRITCTASACRSLRHHGDLRVSGRGAPLDRLQRERADHALHVLPDQKHVAGLTVASSDRASRSEKCLAANATFGKSCCTGTSTLRRCQDCQRHADFACQTGKRPADLGTWRASLFSERTGFSPGTVGRKAAVRGGQGCQFDELGDLHRVNGHLSRPDPKR